MAGSEYSRNGDWILNTLELKSYEGKIQDLTELLETISYTEDIFNNTVYGEITLKDGVDLVQYFPIIGEEELTFNYQTHHNGQPAPVNKIFYVYKVSNKEKLSDNLVRYTLHFCSRELLKNANSRVSKSYKSKKIDSIINDLYYSKLGGEKPLELDSFKNIHHVIIPNWTPFEAINWCCANSQHPAHKGSMYLFYEDKDGYKVKHIETLYSQSKVADFKSFIENVNSENSSSQEGQSYSIESYQVLSDHDALETIANGMHAAQIISYDNIAKKIKKDEWNYESDFGSLKHLRSDKIHSSNFEFQDKNQRVVYVPTKTYREEDSGYFQGKVGQAFSTKVEEIAKYRKPQLAMTDHTRIRLGCYGNNELTCGQIINIEIPNSSAIESKHEKRKDEFMSGDVLIYRCTHTFNKLEYMTTLECLSDSYDSLPTYGF